MYPYFNIFPLNARNADNLYIYMFVTQAYFFPILSTLAMYCVIMRRKLLLKSIATSAEGSSRKVCGGFHCLMNEP
jgi:hypothetical protein